MIFLRLTATTLQHLRQTRSRLVSRECFQNRSTGDWRRKAGRYSSQSNGTDPSHPILILLPPRRPTLLARAPDLPTGNSASCTETTIVLVVKRTSRQESVDLQHTVRDWSSFRTHWANLMPIMVRSRTGLDHETITHTGPQNKLSVVFKTY